MARTKKATKKSAPAPSTVVLPALPGSLRKGAQTTTEFFTLGDVNKINKPKMKYDVAGITPGGSYNFKHRMAYLGVGTLGMIEKEGLLDKTFSLSKMLVDGKQRPVITEDADGNLKFVVRTNVKVCKKCGKTWVNKTQYMAFRKADAEIMSLLETPFHPGSAKFELRKLKGKALRFAFESAERCRV